MFLSVFYILEEKAFGSTVLPEKAMIESACDLRRSSKTFNTFSGPAFETVWCFFAFANQWCTFAVHSVMCNWKGKVGIKIETHSILPPLKSFKLKWAWNSTMV